MQDVNNLTEHFIHLLLCTFAGIECDLNNFNTNTMLTRSYKNNVAI